MRKKNKVFLILALLLVGVIFSGCTRAIPNNTPAEDVPASGGDQLGAILTEVAQSEPVGEETPGPKGDDGGDPWDAVLINQFDAGAGQGRLHEGLCLTCKEGFPNGDDNRALWGRCDRHRALTRWRFGSALRRRHGFSRLGG